MFFLFFSARLSGKKCSFLKIDITSLFETFPQLYRSTNSASGIRQYSSHFSRAGNYCAKKEETTVNCFEMFVIDNSSKRNKFLLQRFFSKDERTHGGRSLHWMTLRIK